MLPKEAQRLPGAGKQLHDRGIPRCQQSRVEVAQGPLQPGRLLPELLHSLGKLRHGAGKAEHGPGICFAFVEGRGGLVLILERFQHSRPARPDRVGAEVVPLPEHLAQPPPRWAQKGEEGVLQATGLVEGYGALLGR